jgi:uroporphyrinogen decarboxylase
MPLFDPEFLALTLGFDVETFWEENGQCYEFTPLKPRCPLSFSPDDHWLFEFFAVPSTLRYYRDKPYRDSLHREANALLREYVGRTYFDEDTWSSSPRRIENLFGCELVYREGGTPWLAPVVADDSQTSAAAFSRILDRAAETDLARWALPEDFLEEWDARRETGRALQALGGGSRGPATVITSVLKPETAFLWMHDRPQLMHRFTSLLAEKMVALNQLLRDFSGNTTPGWWITDDNCALFSPGLYREYCFPVLERVLEALAPPPSLRYQHSDSAMSHLLEQQYALGIRAVNYGPTVDAAQIREKMPGAWILGQVPPFLLRNGSAEAIRQRVCDDFRKAGREGGLEITTAGSLASGTGLGRMRWLMKVTAEETRYK